MHADRSTTTPSASSAPATGTHLARKSAVLSAGRQSTGMSTPIADSTYIVMAYIVMGCIMLAYIVMAYVVMAYIMLAYIVMAYVVMAGSRRG